MKSISDVTVCVIDTGLFLNFARTMARKAKRVLYFNPEVRSYPSLHQHCVGDGFPELEVVREFWSQFEEIDLFCFPDVGQGPLQQYLRAVGKLVWGAGAGEQLELKRQMFLDMLGKLGLEVPEYHVCAGLSELRHYLHDKEDQYVKISRYRGDMETHHYRNYRMDQTWLDTLAIQFGPLQDRISFLVFPAIDCEIEIGGDTYCVDGQWPKLMLNGVEGKDKSYFSCVTRWEDMPPMVTEVMEAFSPILSRTRYRQQWSSEIRVTDEGKAFFIDPTCRGGMPSSGSQQLLWENFPEIVLAGAHGELLDPEPIARYSIETMITAKDEDNQWCSAEIPEELEGKALFYRCCKVDGLYAFPPAEYGHRDLGWLVATGNTPEEVLQNQKDAADLLPDGLNADVEALASVIQDIDKAEKDGVSFGQHEMPEAASVL